jgi:predicted lipoprotein with Yx(FWY)xxD motif
MRTIARVLGISFSLALLAQLPLWTSTAVAVALPGVPAGIKVVATELDGRVYADNRGHTLYTWYGDKERNKSECKNIKYTEATGGTGVKYGLPEPDKRLTCTQAWPPLVAARNAKPAGDWNVISREDGIQQWAYNGKPVYTSHLDHASGDVNGIGMGYWSRVGGGRMPLRVPLDDAPPGVSTVGIDEGRAFAVDHGKSLLYTTDGEQPDCSLGCTDGSWKAFTASSLATSRGNWAVVEKQGLRQWAYRGQLLYTYVPGQPGLTPDDENTPGWKPALYSELPARPREVTIQMTSGGKAYADKEGRTLYFFGCNEEAPDRQLCDVEGTTSVYRLGICGGPDKCKEVYQPMIPARGAKAPGRSWTIMHVDERTGAILPPDKSKDGQAVWAYRGRPVYTYVGDKAPGDTVGDGYQIFFMASYEMLGLSQDIPDIN